MRKLGLKIPTYDATNDGNVFHWIIAAAEEFRGLRQRERYIEMEKALLKEKAKDDNERH